MEENKRTILYEEHLKLNAKMVPFAGFEMPIEYTSISEEHLAVRHQVGLFDVSHMGEIRLKGKDAVPLIDYLSTNRITGAKDGKVIYTILCQEDGGIIDDLMVYKFSDENILLIVNASNTDKDYQWITSHRGSFDVEIINESSSFGEVALQGPLSQAVLQPLVDVELDTLYFMQFIQAHFNGQVVYISRSGYTGEDGFEIFTAPQTTLKLWQTLLGDPRVKPCGLGARDTLRFEAALPLYGHEISDTTTPLEAGLNFGVKLDKPFIGSEALVKQKVEGVPRTLVGLTLLDRGIARQGYEVVRNGHVIGVITTGYMLPNAKEAIALALIQSDYAHEGDLVDVMIRQKPIKAQIRNTAFYQKKYKRK
jgi:aminomethyltransferase